MSEFRARIGRVRMKNGGADVRVIQRSDPDDEDWRGKIIEHARKIADLSDEADPLVGFFIIGMFGKGTTSSGFRYDAEKCPIPRALLPVYVAEITRRDILMNGEARDTFNDMFEWRDN